MKEYFDKFNCARCTNFRREDKTKFTCLKQSIVLYTSPEATSCIYFSQRSTEGAGVGTKNIPEEYHKH